MTSRVECSWSDASSKLWFAGLVEPRPLPPNPTLFMAASLIMVAIVSLARVLWKSSQRVASEHVVRLLGERSVDKVQRRLQADTSLMSVAELRGYVRARATEVLWSEARLLEAETGGQPRLSDDVVTRALERTVHLVMRQLMTTPAATLPVRAAG
jgi:hypothetical protein